MSFGKLNKKNGMDTKKLGSPRGNCVMCMRALFKQQQQQLSHSR